MTFTREINRLLLGTLLAFFVVFGAALYWSVVGADSILLRNDNPRLVEAEASIQRGTITDRHGTILAQTIINVDDIADRVYPEPDSYSAVGYYSLRYGSGGIEAAFDAILRGENTNDTLASYFNKDILHRPQVGSDIVLTIDLAVQQALQKALEGQRGAGVVISIPDGGVLGMISNPTYDPNSLDEEWETFVAQDGNPFYNRVLQGQYQPGGMLQTPLMTAAILTEQSLDVVTADGNLPIRLDGVEVGCALMPPRPDLTYAEAYAYACPRPFSLMINTLTPETLQNVVDAFRLDTPPLLDGFTAQAVIPEVTPETEVQPNLLQNVLGQGTLTINPLRMATIAAAVINEGNAPQPYVLQAIIKGDDQQTVTRQYESLPIMTAPAARQMRELMIANIQTGAAASAAMPDEIIGGHAARAISGDDQQVWFIGFITLGDNRGAAIALVLETEDDVELVASISGQTLTATAAALRSETP